MNGMILFLLIIKGIKALYDRVEKIYKDAE
jgi:hypothetical protein